MTPASKVKAGVEMFSISNHEKELQSGEKRISDASYSEKDKKLLFDFENDLYTGMRRVQIIFAVPYLSSWLAIHPGRHNPEALAWVAIGARKQDQPMKYESYRMLLKHAAQKAGLKEYHISFNIKEKKVIPER